MGTAAAAKADADSVASAAGTYAIEEDGFGTGRASLMFGESCRAAGRVSSVGVPFPALVPGPELFFFLSTNQCKGCFLVSNVPYTLRRAVSPVPELLFLS